MRRGPVGAGGFATAPSGFESRLPLNASHYPHKTHIIRLQVACLLSEHVY